MLWDSDKTQAINSEPGKMNVEQRSTLRCPPNFYSPTMVWTDSPDLTLSDFHLFPKLKEHFSGMHFNNDDEVKDAVQRFLNSMAVNWYDMGIRKIIVYACKNASIEMAIM